MSEHLIEAIAINRKRKPMYAKLTKGKSLKISRSLIASEALSLLSSVPLDIISKYWRNRNIPVMKHEFISMSLTPDFKESFEDPQGISPVFPKINTKLMQSNINQVFKQKDYDQLSDCIEAHLNDLNQFSKHFCMVRHILESILRSSNLAKVHIQKANEMHVRSPELFCRYLIYSQIIVIHSSSLLDKWAYPLQKDGIPILYQDVPVIPPMPEQY
jgi:hypothetical protein